jgi:CRISPR-associated endonuclease/helicase Cas3
MQLYDNKFFEDLIPNCSQYFAHLPDKEQPDKKPELLSEHSALVVKYARKIAETHNLNNIIEKLILDTISTKLRNKKLLAQIIQRLFWQAIAFHDLGKLNHYFQYNRMKNRVGLLKVSHPFENKHSIIGVYLFLALFFRDFLKMNFSDEEQVFMCNVAMYLSYTIFRHHAQTMEKAQDNTNWDNENLFVLKPYLTLFKNRLNDEQIEIFHSCFLKNANFNFLFDRFNNHIDFKTENAFPLFALIKLNYSLLTASDYLATAHYMNDWRELLADFGILNKHSKEKIIINAKTLKPYNKAIYGDMANGRTANPDNYTIQSNDNLNALRSCIAMEIIVNVKKNADKNLFYIEAPTGGGKTNVSMLALAELLKSDKSIQKVFYVFPFTTLITQTYQSLIETLNLDESEIAEIHSKAALSKRKEENSDYLNYLDNLFMSYPVTLLSHIRFFDVLKTNAKETNYLLHRLANSVVIVDEIQSYSPKIWDKIIYFIVNYAKYFNMKFIIMSATLPKIGDIIDRKELANDFVYLVTNKNQYFQNPNFCNRVQFDYSLLEWEKPDKNEISNYLEKLNVVVFEKSIHYAETNIKYPQSVFTIVEFIFKKTASEFYSIACKKKDFFDEILLLSGTILETRRTQIINKLKSAETRKRKILLVTTQVVEAGVDIDMDLGFKDKSIIDSEEQLAGRINRNVNKSDCKLYLFDCNAEKILYSGDERYSLMQDIQDEYQTILEQKDFDKLYRIIIQKIKGKNKSSFIVNIEDLFTAMGTLDFKEVDKSLKIIDQQNKTVFVPLEINISLMKKSIKTLEELNIPYSTVLKGTDVWNKYSELIVEQDEDFVKNKILMKKMQSVLSLFTFSIFPNGRDYDTLKTYGWEKYGFLYLESYKDVYSFEDGIKTDCFENSNFL